MQLSVLIPDTDVLLALEPEELGLRLLPLLNHWSSHSISSLELGNAINVATKAFPNGKRDEIDGAIREAWAWLEGQALLIPSSKYIGNHTIRVLSRRAIRLAKESDPHRAFSARRLPKDALHQKIREDVWALYHRGRFDTAVFEAMKAIEVAVREAAKLATSDIGTKLMRKAFDVDNGPLTDKAAEQGERQACSDLFAGAIGSYKNPHSHRNVALDDPDEAAEIILLASHLLRIVDARIS